MSILIQTSHWCKNIVQFISGVNCSVICNIITFYLRGTVSVQVLANGERLGYGKKKKWD